MQAIMLDRLFPSRRITGTPCRGFRADALAHQARTTAFGASGLWPCSVRTLAAVQSRRAAFALTLVVASLAAASQASAQNVLRVNGHGITLQELEAVNPQAASNLQVREQVANQLAQQQLLADSLQHPPTGLDARIQAVQQNAQRQILAQQAADDYLAAHPVSESALKQAYDAQLANWPEKQYWTRWIVVKTPEQARSVLDALRSGKASFTTLAITQSIGQNAELGGALGWQTDRTLPAAVLAVVRKLKPNEVAGPISLDTGFAIVQWIAERTNPKPTFDALKPQLELQLRNAALQNHIQTLAKSAKIENLMQDQEKTSATSQPPHTEETRP
jgi:peptidyl-prolyl cis-trans isomerase C